MVVVHAVFTLFTELFFYMHNLLLATVELNWLTFLTLCQIQHFKHAQERRCSSLLHGVDISEGFNSLFFLLPFVL